jgi:antitoxin HicB
MLRFAYPARLRREPEGGFTVTFPDMPEAITHGSDKARALIQAADCLDEAIANRIVMKLAVPPPGQPRGGCEAVLPSALMAAKAALYMAAKSAGVSNLELARRLGCDEKEVRRILDPRHTTKITRIDQTLAVLGKRLIVAMHDAA